MRVLLAFLLLSALVTTAAAAGAETGASPTVASYRAKANAICTSLGNFTPTGGTAEAKLASFVKRFNSAIAEIAAVPAPASLANLRSQIVAVLHLERSLVDGEFAKVKAGKISGAQFNAAIDSSDLDKKEIAIWRKIGATVCAQP